MEQKDFIRSIIENGQGKLSQADLRVLEAWKAKSDDNRLYAESIEKTLALTGDFGKNLEFDPSSAFVRFQEKVNKTEVIPLINTNSRRNFMKIAASLAILVAVLSSLWFSQISSSNQMVSVFSEKGESLTLVDKTKVILNKKASLEHFTAISSNPRVVNLKGEAFFDVYRMTDKPFIINTNSIQIEVLGTSFNVRDLDSEDECMVYVKSGKVKINSIATPRTRIILTAGEQAIFNKKTGAFRKSNDHILNALSWMEGKLSFNKTKLKYAIQDLERYFDISIDLKNKSLEECEYTSLFNEPQKASIIETIAATFNLQLKQIGDSTYELNGGSCE